MIYAWKYVKTERFKCLIIVKICFANNRTQLQLAEGKHSWFFWWEVRALFLDLVIFCNQPWEATGSHVALLPLALSCLFSFIFSFCSNWVLDAFRLKALSVVFLSKRDCIYALLLNDELKVWMVDIVLELFWNKFLSQYIIYGLFVGGELFKEWYSIKLVIIYIFPSLVSLKWTAVKLRQVDFSP